MKNAILAVYELHQEERTAGWIIGEEHIPPTSFDKEVIDTALSDAQTVILEYPPKAPDEELRARRMDDSNPFYAKRKPLIHGPSERLRYLAEDKFGKGQADTFLCMHPTYLQRALLFEHRAAQDEQEKRGFTEAFAHCPSCTIYSKTQAEQRGIPVRGGYAWKKHMRILWDPTFISIMYDDVEKMLATQAGDARVIMHDALVCSIPQEIERVARLDERDSRFASAINAAVQEGNMPLCVFGNGHVTSVLKNLGHYGINYQRIG